ncbi:MAG: FtsX-like permease family protein [Nocardioidaceae bacterium]|nr:FtsX-like permease family protein [Nocardioidaceae bacterium]
MNWRPVRSWRLPLRIAARDARRARSRSILVLVMIALPVTAVTIADTLYSTQDLSGVEGLDRRLGTSAAKVELVDYGGVIVQGFDPDSNSGHPQAIAQGRGNVVKDVSGVQAVLGGDRTAVPYRYGGLKFETDAGLSYGEAIETDLRSPLVDGIFTLNEGRLPQNSQEVLVNSAVTERGPGLGDQLVVGTLSLDIVGIAESTSSTGSERVFAPLGAFEAAGADGTKAVSALETYGGKQFLIGGGPVSWDQVRALNAVGVAVTSRAVISDPPPTSELPEEARPSGSIDSASLTVLVLLVVMVLIEVVLLAGPAFAVGARRQTRTLALIGAAGGSPTVARRVILSTGIVLGTLGGGIGVLMGIVGAWVLMPLFQRLSDQRFGPYDVTWTHLLGVGVFGLVSALLAAAVPAWIASRQDVVAILGGRRGDTRASRRSPILGLALVGAGVTGAVFGAKAVDGSILIAGSAIVSVLGMILLVPLVVVGVARASRRLPLAMRFAARDAALHRTRTVPAVAAVAATVAGVVALGIAISSDEAQNRGDYQPRLATGQAALSDYGSDAPWGQLKSAVEQRLPEASPTTLRGVSYETGRDEYIEVRLRTPGGRQQFLSQWGGYSNAAMLVGDDSLPPASPQTSAADRAAATEVLRSGGVVVFTDKPVRADKVVVAVNTSDNTTAKRTDRLRETFPAVYLQVLGGPVEAPGVLSEQATRALGLTPAILQLMFDQGATVVDKGTEQDIAEAVAAISTEASFYVERGYQTPDSTVIVQLILAGLGGVLMLGGTLTATFLALSDARPDLATLSAVGASPRTRRRVAAGYALVVGLVGALLGALIGAIPGIAISYPLTAPYDGSGSSHYLNIPWLLLIGVVVGLPLFTSALVGLTARSRLPLVARLD